MLELKTAYHNPKRCLPNADPYCIFAATPSLRSGGMNQRRRIAPNWPTRSAASISLLGPFRVNRRRLRGTPQAYRGDLDPGEQRDDEQVIGHARQQEQHYR
jgi:hypothetical protein